MAETNITDYEGDEVTLSTEETFSESAAISAGETVENDGAVMLGSGETDTNEGATLSSGGDYVESGIETEVLGDGQPPEHLEEPRDNVSHRADHTFENNVTIAGTLRAKRFYHPYGGLFLTKEKLLEEIPSPRNGMWALVGAGFPARIYMCIEDGKWIEASEYYEKMADIVNDVVVGEYLSRTHNDRAKGHITFEQGAHFGDFFAGLYAGRGGAIDSRGNAEVESLRVRTFMEVMELITNRLTAIEGDQLLTEGDTIERVIDNGDNTYDIYLRAKWEGYYTAQAQNNVIKGTMNTLAAGPGTYYTSWMRVNSVNPALNFINVTLYPDDEVPAGRNFPPCETMNIARWGNQTDPTRQSCLYLSSTEGRIVKLTGVTKPILENWNYGATFGVVPEFLKLLNLPLAEGQDYIYARGIIAQEFLRVDYQGKPVVTYVDRGPWDPNADYYCEATNPVTGIFETSDVWYKGCKYRCMRTGTHNAPAWNSTDWAMIEGNPEFTVDFAEADNVFDPDNFDTTLTIVAKLYNMDITADIHDTDIVWTRYSEDPSGNPRTASDNVWALTHAGAGKSVHLTKADCDFDGYIPKVLRFTATVTLRDGEGEEVDTQSVAFEY